MLSNSLTFEENKEGKERIKTEVGENKISLNKI
jgi:hypothetical protein